MESLKKLFALKPDHDDAIKRIEALENKPTQVSSNGEIPSDLLERLNKMQSQLKQHELALQGLGQLD